MTFRTFLMAAVVVTATATLAAQPPGVKILLLYDMEGVTGATDFKHTTVAHPAEYAEGRRSLTADVNAAIAGLKEGGATEIVVVDGHGSGNSSGPDVLEDELVAPAKMHYRDTPFDIYMDSYDHSFDAIVAVAMHAGAGNRVGFLSHTYTLHDVEYRVNGAPFNESMILAAGAARLKIPLVMVSGDDQLEKEIRRNLPWVRYATVKHAVDRSGAESVDRAEASRRIEAAARDAVQHLSEARVPEWTGPYRFAVGFQDVAQARNAALVPGAESDATATMVQIRANDFEEGYRLSLRLINAAGVVARGDVRQGVIDSLPDAAAVRTAVTDRGYDRFLGRLPEPPAPPAPAASGQRARYWGAR